MFSQEFGVFPKTLHNSADGAISGKDYRIVECLTDTVFSSVTSATETGESKYAGVTLPAGTRLWDIQAMTITSGLVRGHNKER